MMGTLAMEGRLILLDKVALPLVFHHTEAWANITSKEIQKMEQSQSQMINTIQHAPKNTPYYGLLWKPGMITIGSGLKYKKMMLYHNLMNSEIHRLAKGILMFQNGHIVYINQRNCRTVRSNTHFWPGINGRRFGKKLFGRKMK